MSHSTIVGITAGEAKNPSQTLPRAIRNTFFRIVFFYIVTIFLIGMCVPSNDRNLANSHGSAATASFTLIFQLAGINGGAHFVNTVILVRYMDQRAIIYPAIQSLLTATLAPSVLSAANSSLYTTARTLLGLARDGNAPAFLGRVNRFGAPYW